jgi:hypothetical protein
MEAKIAAAQSAEPHRSDPDFAEFRRKMQVGIPIGPLFTTDAEGLFEAWLAAMPEADRQYHRCHCCRRFLETYGGLVTISETGEAIPTFWTEEGAPGYYQTAESLLWRLVRRSKVTGVFLSPLPVWGQPITGPWTHLAVTPDPSQVYRANPLKTAGQAMAEKREDYNTVARALTEFTLPILEQAMRLLESDALYRSEKVAGPARWLRDLHAARETTKNSMTRDNLLWRAIATAPAGFCHPRASMVGTLLEDIAAGMDFAEVSRRFAAKMHPLQYQRPTSAPSAGNIAAAEKLFETLGLAPSLVRRFARVDEVTALWMPVAPKTPASGNNGVFAHLKPKSTVTSALVIPPSVMTWEKFSRTVLPTAETIEYQIPAHGAFTAFVTAVNADAPPILQWDAVGKRNPVSWYMYHMGSMAPQWGLTTGSYTKVTAITENPAHWGCGPDEFTHQGRSIILILDGCKDSNGERAGAAIFPETLKAELREVRSTIEAYSRGANLTGLNQASACGICLSKGQPWNATIRVTTGGVRQDYKLDRWD